MAAWGAWDRNTGFCVMMPLEKLDDNGDYRPGPAKISEVLPLVVKYITPGCTICSDGLLAYKNSLTTLGYAHTLQSTTQQESLWMLQTQKITHKTLKTGGQT